MNSAAGSATRLQADFVLSGGDFNQSAAKSTGALHRTPCRRDRKAAGAR